MRKSAGDRDGLQGGWERMLKETSPPISGSYWHLVRPPWNVTLITLRPSLSLLLTLIALSATYF